MRSSLHGAFARLRFIAKGNEYLTSQITREATKRLCE
jgi:hypothetical protein